MRRFPGFLSAAAISLATVAAVVPARAATVTGRIAAGPNLRAPERLSVAIDSWVCGKDGSIEDPTLEIGADHGLANVVVHLAGVPDAPPFPARGAPVIDQRGCVFEPHVLLVAAGQEVEVRNDDAVLHNFHTQSARNRAVNRAQPKGKVDTVRFTEPETIRVECDVHYWMSAVVVVAADAYTAVTAADGRFSIDGVPPGTYRAELWHEKLGSRDASVTVDDGGGSLEWTWDAAPPPTEP